MHRTAAVHRTACITLIALASQVYAPAAGAAEYSVAELAVLPPASSQIVGALNNRGQLVGSVTQRAFVASHTGLEEIDVGAGADYSAARDINDVGEVVGSLNRADAITAFHWTPGGGVRYLPPLPGDAGSEAFRINLSGQVAGYSSGVRGIRAVLWSRDGTVHELAGLPKGRYSRALAINNRREVVGSVGRAPARRAFLWAESALKDLGTLRGDGESEAVDINEAGDAVGWSKGRGGARAVMWSSGEIRNLGVLAGATNSRARAVNARGDVVGDSGSGHDSRAFLWTRARGMQDLNALIAASPFVLLEAVSINDQGQIVALGRDEARSHHAHHSHGRAVPVRVFLLVPGP